VRSATLAVRPLPVIVCVTTLAASAGPAIAATSIALAPVPSARRRRIEIFFMVDAPSGWEASGRCELAHVAPGFGRTEGVRTVPRPSVPAFWDGLPGPDREKDGWCPSTENGARRGRMALVSPSDRRRPCSRTLLLGDDAVTV